MTSEIFYSVRDKKFSNKVEALRYASLFNDSKFSDIKFFYHHKVWNNFDRSLLGKISLKQLYKERAQQIRDRYDYVILYFSGGADSTNILESFLNNNIPLDEIVVRWPKKLIGSSIYTPNNVDKTARNFVSEWDLVIEKELKKIAQSHPNIKITILDYIEGIDNFKYHDDLFLTQNHFHSAINLLRMQKFTDLEHVSRGKKVCSVMGFDKPMVCEVNGSAFMYFPDNLVAQAIPSAEESTRENFYWSPDFPILAYEMAYQVYLNFKLNPFNRQVLLNSINKSVDGKIKFDITQMYFDIIKPIIYETWDMSKFQAEKPTHGFKADKDFWFYESNEFKLPRQQWQYFYRSQLDNISEVFCQVENGDKTGYKIVLSPLYFLGTFS